LKRKLKQAVFQAFLSFMKPTAKLLLFCGVTWKEFAELTKLAMVAAAADELGTRGRAASTSRIALATGLSRREVRRVRDLVESPTFMSDSSALQTVNHASRVLTGWHRDPDFRSRSGAPRLLTFDGDAGFEVLARRYAPDIPPVAVLRELKQVGAINETPAGKLRAMTRYYMPTQLAPQSVLRTGDVLGDVSDTVMHNLFTDDDRTRFEARATNLRVKRRAIRAFQDLLEVRAMDFLQEADDWLSDHEASNEDETAERVGVGIYMIRG